METLYATKEAQLVARGIEWLDDTDPDWFNKVDLEKFSFWQCDRCVLGQAFAAFDPDAAGYTFILDMFGLDWVKERGFCVTSDDRYRGIDAEDVIQLWVKTITNRQAASA